MTKFTDLAAVKQAMEEGRIEDPVIILDNDSSSLLIGGEMVDEFDVHPELLLEQALDLLGILHDGV